MELFPFAMADVYMKNLESTYKLVYRGNGNSFFGNQVMDILTVKKLCRLATLPTVKQIGIKIGRAHV